jgi:hypothetical protein
LNYADVGLMNARTLMYAEQAYSGNADFAWQKSDTSLGTASDFIENKE